MGTLFSCWEEPEFGSDERRALLSGTNDVGEEGPMPAAHSTDTLPPDERTAFIPQVSPAPPSTNSAIHTASPHIIPQTSNGTSPAVALLSASTEDATSTSHPAISRSVLDDRSAELLAAHDILPASATNQKAYHSDPIDRLEVGIRSGFDGLRQEMQRNTGEIASMRGDVSTLVTRARETATHGMRSKASLLQAFSTLKLAILCRSGAIAYRASTTRARCVV